MARTIFYLACIAAFCHESDFITYDWLLDCGAKTAYTNHIPHFKKLFETIKVRGFLECGCGFSTKYFLDHCERVISVEFLNLGTDLGWFKKCLELYRGIKNWTPLVYNADLRDITFDDACSYACREHKDYSTIDSSYLDRLNLFFKKQIIRAHERGYDIDVAFVDAGVYLRGSLAKLLIENKVPIVIAHDTACDLGLGTDTYLWFVVKTPDDYEKIFIPHGSGTTFWIHKSLPHVIESIVSHKNSI